MERKHIDIQGMSIKTGPWIHTVPAKPFTFLTADRVSFAIVERNYYLDTKTNKIKYQKTDCTMASYKHLYSVYMEVYPGLFAFTETATETSITTVLNKYSKIYHENDYSNNPAVNTWREQLKHID